MRASYKRVHTGVRVVRSFLLSLPFFRNDGDGEEMR